MRNIETHVSKILVLWAEGLCESAHSGHCGIDPIARTACCSRKEFQDAQIASLQATVLGAIFDDDEITAAHDFRAAVEDMLGVDLRGDLDGTDADGTSPQDIIAKVQAQIQAQMEAMQAQQLEAARLWDQAYSQRLKTQKQLEREAKAKLESERTSQSIREVYRKLVSSLHPDREPDAADRARKTALMQRVNQAYDKKDLLKLLELQLELEHIHASSIAGLSEDRLKHFNKVLKEQLAELEQEIEQIEMPLRAQFRVSFYAVLIPQSILLLLQGDIAAMKRDIKHLKTELLVTMNLTAFKAWNAARKREAKTTKAMRFFRCY